LLRARQVGLRESDIGLRKQKIGARLRQSVLERPAVDGEEQVTLLHDLPVLEMHAVEGAGHAGAHFDRIHRQEAADIFVLLGHRLLDRLGNRHGRWRRGGLLLLAAGGQERREQEKWRNKTRWFEKHWRLLLRGPTIGERYRLPAAS
jgi:hypothetical protein